MADEPRAIPLVYVDAEEHPAQLATTFGIVTDPANDEFILTIGQLQLPILIGDEKDKAEQLKQISYVGIKVLGRYSMTHTRVKELMTVLTGNLEQYEQRAQSK